MTSPNEILQYWETFPKKFIDQLKEKIGEEKFVKLTDILVRYEVFKEDAFKDVNNFTEETACEFSEDKTQTQGWLNLSHYLGSLGSSLGQTDRDEYIPDALEVLELAIIIFPENPVARMTYALLCYCFSDLQEKAKVEAKKTVELLEKIPSLVPDNIKEEMVGKMDIILKDEEFGEVPGEEGEENTESE